MVLYWTRNHEKRRELHRSARTISSPPTAFFSYCFLRLKQSYWSGLIPKFSHSIALTELPKQGGASNLEILDKMNTIPPLCNRRSPHQRARNPSTTCKPPLTLRLYLRTIKTSIFIQIMQQMILEHNKRALHKTKNEGERLKNCKKEVVEVNRSPWKKLHVCQRRGSKRLQKSVIKGIVLWGTELTRYAYVNTR